LEADQAFFLSRSILQMSYDVVAGYNYARNTNYSKHSQPSYIMFNPTHPLHVLKQLCEKAKTLNNKLHRGTNVKIIVPNDPNLFSGFGGKVRPLTNVPAA
jgi:hypothetical protein